MKYIEYELEKELWINGKDSVFIENLKLLANKHWNRSNHLKFALEAILEAKSIEKVKQIAAKILAEYRAVENPS